MIVPFFTILDRDHRQLERVKLPRMPGKKLPQTGIVIAAIINSINGNQPRGPGKSIIRRYGCTPEMTMCRDRANTRPHFSTEMNINRNNMR